MCFYCSTIIFIETLPDFIARHTLEKLCLPCVLKLPQKGKQDTWQSHDCHVTLDSPRLKKSEASPSLNAAGKSDKNFRFDKKFHFHFPPLACDLVLLGNIEVLHSAGDSIISEAARQLKALDLPTSTIVNFKASVQGITVTDKANG